MLVKLGTGLGSGLEVKVIWSNVEAVVVEVVVVVVVLRVRVRQQHHSKAHPSPEVSSINKG